MKRFISIMIVIALCLCGCNNTTLPETTPTATEASGPAPTTPSEPAVAVKQAPLYAVSLPILVEYEYAEDGAPVFSLAYQNMSLSMPEPEVADKIIVDFLNRTDISQEAEEIARNAKTSYEQSQGDFIPYLYNVIYEPVRLDPNVLSLMGTTSIYSGGVHSENIAKAVTYDLLTGNPLSCSAILLETVSGEDLIPLVEKALSSQKDNLYEEYSSIVEEKFLAGTDHNADWYLSSEGLCFFFSPYEIGPFSSGTVTACVPYDQLTGILRDSYFPTERDTAFGAVETIPYDQADLSQYTQYTELITDSGAEKKLLYTESSVQDIRIMQRISINPITSYAPTYTIFAAYMLTPGDAIVLETQNTCQLSYTTGTELINEDINP